jgi:acetyltransferase-like isoleucine patch superfamily enzyme
MSISRFSIVSAKASLGKNVSIGDFSVVHDNVRLADDVVIESHCVIGYPTAAADGDPLVIGQGARIRTHSVFYEGSEFGPGLVTGHRVTVREKFKAGKNLQIGTLCDFQGHATVGDHVKTHSNVHIGHKTEIGNCVWIFPYTVFTNDPHPPSDGYLRGVVVEDYAVIATMCSLMPGVRVGTRSLVGAHSLVTRDVEPDTVVGGVPAKKLGMASDIKLKGTDNAAYPWMRHFHRGYPEELIREWTMLYGAAGK